MDVWDTAADTGGDDHFIDNFTITIPGTVSNGVDQTNSLTVQGQHGIGKLTLAYFNITADPITSCSSTDVFTFTIPVLNVSMVSIAINKLIRL